MLSKLTGEQALDVLQRLAAGKGAVADAILAEAKRVLAAVDVEEVANEVFAQLDGIGAWICLRSARAVCWMIGARGTARLRQLQLWMHSSVSAVRIGRNT